MSLFLAGLAFGAALGIIPGYLSGMGHHAWRRARETANDLTGNRNAERLWGGDQGHHVHDEEMIHVA